MACFLVSTAEAVIVTAVKKAEEKKEKELELQGVVREEGHIPFSVKLGWLTKMLWGGVFLLLIEHIYHGEVVLYPPFLTAMYSAADTQAMLYEMATVGVSMAFLVTAIWGVMVGISVIVEKRRKNAAAEAEK
ncbi:MAG: hypothetical protein K6F99_02385 [Lachnospiraceae bacterium]|nr:hypothetical protein [Lachnospiraceae bacterium]